MWGANLAQIDFDDIPYFSSAPPSAPSAAGTTSRDIKNTSTSSASPRPSESSCQGLESVRSESIYHQIAEDLEKQA